MYEKLIYTNALGESVEFSHKSIFFCNVSQVEGISDVHNTVYTSESMGQDGTTQVGSKLQSRYIAIQGAIRTQSIGEILAARRILNRVLNPKLAATLTYEYGAHKRVISCTPEEAPVFIRKKIFQELSIELVCPSPYWRAATEEHIPVAAWLGEFEFPLESAGLEIPQTGLEMGVRNAEALVTVVNNGDVTCSLRVEFSADGEVDSPKLINVETFEFIEFPGLIMQAGDRLVVNTAYGNKICKIYRGETVIDVFAYWNINGTFLQLGLGSNTFNFSAASNADRLSVDIYKTDNYLGV